MLEQTREMHPLASESLSKYHKLEDAIAKEEAVMGLIDRVIQKSTNDADAQKIIQTKLAPLLEEATKNRIALQKEWLDGMRELT